jgi:hypothetical protein
MGDKNGSFLSSGRENLEKLADEHVNREAKACYWWRLLTTWEKQQPEESRTNGFQLVN